MKAIWLVIYLIFFGVSAQSQTIEKFSIDSGGGTFTNGNIQILFSLGEVNIQERASANIQLSEGFINPHIVLAISLDPKVFLQGPLLNPTTVGLMNDDLRTASHIPLTSPYTDTATADASVFNITGNEAIVDWVWIELRDPIDNNIFIYGKSALLQRDGDIVDLDGTSNLSIDISAGDYYLVIDHRNHLGVMTNAPIALTNAGPNQYDFTATDFPTYGANAQVVLSSGNTALWAGDTDGSGQVRFSGSGNGSIVIKDYVLADPSNLFGLVTYQSSGYLNIDVDMNGFGRFSGSGNDRNILKDNVLMHPGNLFGLPTYTIITTVPPKN